MSTTDTERIRLRSRELLISAVRQNDIVHMIEQRVFDNCEQTVGAQFRELMTAIMLILHQRPELVKALERGLLAPRSLADCIQQGCEIELLEYIHDILDDRGGVHFGNYHLCSNASRIVIRFLSRGDISQLSKTARDARPVSLLAQTWRDKSSDEFGVEYDKWTPASLADRSQSLHDSTSRSLSRTATFEYHFYSANSPPRTSFTQQPGVTDRPKRRRSHDENASQSDCADADTVYSSAEYDGKAASDISTAPLLSATKVTQPRRARGEDWKAYYRRLIQHHRLQAFRKANYCKPCTACGTNNAIVRYHQRSVTFIKYSQCAACGCTIILEKSTGDMPKMGSILDAGGDG
jgi:hypothetical protein